VAHGHGGGSGDEDRDLCVCFHVPRRKVESFCRRERPKVASLISECLSAGTGCGWCIPYLKAIHAEVVLGGPAVEVPADEEYRRMRKEYHRKKGIVRPD